jgi:hypothetical protein
MVGARTFLLQENVWMDTSFDPQSMPVQKVVFLSPTYFQLLAARPDLAPALAIGQQVLLVIEGEAYQVVVDGDPGGAIDLPPALAATQIISTTSQPGSNDPTPAATAANPASRPARQTGLCFGAPAVLLAPLVLLAVWRRRSQT